MKILFILLVSSLSAFAGFGNGPVGGTISGGSSGVSSQGVTNTVNTIVTANSYLSSGLPSPFFLLTADSFAPTNSGTVVTGVWPDITGNGNNFNITNVQVSQNGVYGKAALLGNGSTSIGVLSNSLPTSVNTSFTFEIKFYDPSQAGSGFILSSGPSFPPGMGLYPWRVASGTPGGGSVDLLVQTNGGQYANTIWKQFVSHTYMQRFDGTNIDSWLDGVAYHGAYTSTPLTTGIGMAGSLQLWECLTGNNPWAGDIREVVMWTNVLTDAQMWKQWQFDKAQDESLPIDTICLIGTSKTQGAQASSGGDMPKLLAIAFPDVMVMDYGVGGITSGAEVNNITNNFTPQQMQGKVICVWEYFAANDENGVTAGLPMVGTNTIVLTNLVTGTAATKAKGYFNIWYPAMPDLRAGTNGSGNNYVTNSWGREAGLANLPLVDSWVGSLTNDAQWQPPAYGNVSQYPDQLHPSSLVYTNLVFNYLVSVIQNLRAGTNFNGAFTGNGAGLTNLPTGNALTNNNATAVNIFSNLTLIVNSLTNSTASSTTQWSNLLASTSGTVGYSLNTNGSFIAGGITFSNQNLLLGNGNNEGIQSSGFIQFNISGGSGGGKQIQFMDAGNNVLTYDNNGGATWHFIGTGRISFFTNSAAISSITNDPVPGGWVILPNARTFVRVKVSMTDSLTVNGVQQLLYSNAVTGVIKIADQVTVPLGVSGTVSTTNTLQGGPFNPSSMISISNATGGTAIIVVPDNSTSIDAD